MNVLLTSPLRQVKGKVEIYNNSTLRYTWTYEDRLQSFKIEKTGDTSKFYGFGVSQKCNIKLRDKYRELFITSVNSFKIYAAVGDGEYIAISPMMYVTEVNRDEADNSLSITCYDKLYFTSNHKVSEVTSTNYTIGSFINSIASIMGVTSTHTENEFSLSYPKGANFSGDESFKEALDDAAEATQTIYYMDNSDVLKFRRLNTSNPQEINREMYFTLDAKTNRKLVEIASVTELGDNISASLGVSGTTQYIRDNAFWDLREDRATLVNNALSTIGGFTINQFELNWRGDYTLEIGDYLKLETKSGSYVYSYLLEDTLEYSGGLQQKTSWSYSNSDAETDTNSASIGDTFKKTFAKVDKVNNEISLLAQETKTAKENATSALNQVTTVNTKVGELTISQEEIKTSVQEVKTTTETLGTDINSALLQISSINTQMSELSLNQDSINASVQEIEKNTKTTLNGIAEDVSELTKKAGLAVTAQDVSIQIQNSLSNGIDKVETTTGYTFDKNGLNITKSGSNLSTTITEDGMQVAAGGETMLTANSSGVDAVDLRATTYLIIGENCRFEDYGSNRTGCFAIK